MQVCSRFRNTAENELCLHWIADEKDNSYYTHVGEDLLFI
jgi:hypothetical protein